MRARRPRMPGMTPCRHCGGERDQCPRCDYLACPCEPCACETGVSTVRVREAQAFYDAHGCSRSEWAARKMEDALRTGRLPDGSN
jgi:hypothetical protein